MDFGNHLKHHVFRKAAHRRPILDIGPEMDFHIRICHALGIKYTILIDFGIKVVFIFTKGPVEFGSGCEDTFVCGCGCDGTGIHECDGCDLAVLQLASFPVGEVSCGMADTEAVVGRRISCTEAGSAESGLHDSAGLQDGGRTAVFNQFHINRHGSRIYA